MYKSHVVHVPSGEPPNSVSRPVPKKKAGAVKPITQGKLLKAGGPSVSGHRLSGLQRWVTDRWAVLEIIRRLKTQACCSAITREDKRICTCKAQRHFDIDDQTHQHDSPSPATAKSRACATTSTCRTGCRVIQG
jgi:hypothetical protein